MRGLWLVSLLFFLLFNQSDAEINRPILIIPRGKRSPVVDGKISPEEYTDALIFTGFRGAGKGGIAMHRSPLVYITYDNKRLYFAIVSPLRPGESLKQLVCRRDDSLVCMDDAIEIFIYPIRAKFEREDYYQFVCNARGAYYDARYLPSVGQVEPQWNGRWEYKTAVEKKRWIAEVSIPFADIDISEIKDSLVFNLDICRDSPSFTRHFTSFAGAFHQREYSAIATLSDSGPAVQIFSIGSLNDGLVEVKGRLINTGSKPLNLITEIEVISHGKLVFKKNISSFLKTQQSISFSAKKELKNVEKGIFNIQVINKDTSYIYYRQNLPFQTGMPDKPVEVRKQPPVLVRGGVAPSFGIVQAEVDIFNLKDASSISKVKLELIPEGKAQSIAKSELKYTEFERGFASTLLNVPRLKEGKYRLIATVVSTDGRILGRGEDIFQLKNYPWVRNKIGISEKILKPWTPLKISGNMVKCWGKKYVFSGSGFPLQIYSTQPEPTRGPATVKLLTRRSGLVGFSDGKKLRFIPGKLKITESKPSIVKLCGKAESEELISETVGELEYDGFYKVVLTVRPKRKNVKIDNLAIEFPLDSRWVTLLNSVGDMVRGNAFCGALPKKEGMIWHSAMFHNQLVKGNFLPFVWLGNEDRGLAYLADNDKGWILDYTKPCLEVVRQGKEVLFRIVFINRSVELSKPIKILFAIQATPVKPLPQGWRAWLRTTFETSMHKEWPTKEWPKDSKFHTYGQAYPGRIEKPFYWGTLHPTDEEESRKYVESFHKKGVKMYLYINLNKTSANDQEYKDYYPEWVRIPGPKGGYNPVKSFQDYALWSLKKWFISCNIDGIYLDDVYPSPSENIINGCGWIDEEGIVHAGYSLFQSREYVKRLATMLQELGCFPGIWAHTTNTPCIPYLSFVDMFYDGELHGWPDPTIENPDYIDRWPYRYLDRFRACSYTKQFGVVPARLVKDIDRKLDADSAIALIMLHDIFFFDADHTYIIWPLSEFRIWEKDVKYIPYWDVRKLVKVKADNPKVLASTWSRKDRIMVMVSNLGPQDAKVNLQINLSAFNLKEPLCAVDGISRKRIKLSNGKIKHLKVKRHNFVLLLIGPPGLFPTAEEEKFLSKELQPCKIVRQKSDDFSEELSKDWEIKISPDCPRGGAYTWNNRLRIVTRPHRYSFVARDFNLDNVSVQCCIEVESPDYTHIFYNPSLILYWNNGSYVKASLGLHPPYFKGKEPSYLFFVNSKYFVGPPLPMKRYAFPLFKNWVKIGLTPENIKFYCSTDGKIWQEIYTIKRTNEFGGAPSKLILGCAHGTKKEGYPSDFMNDRKGRTGDYRYYYFSELVVGKD